MTVFWKSDSTLFDIAARELFPALVGDCLDTMGLLNQFLPVGLKPIHPEMIVIGRAMPVVEADVSDIDTVTAKDEMLEQPFGLMFRALDDLKPGEVYVCSGASLDYALWGGLMSRRAMRLKAAGAVVNGLSRDTQEIEKLHFPTFSFGTYAQDQGPRGKVVDFRIPIQWGDITICTGDIIFGDRDGVLVIPKAAEEEAFLKAIEKARGENEVKNALENGMSAQAAFDRFGIM